MSAWGTTKESRTATVAPDAEEKHVASLASLADDLQSAKPQRRARLILAIHSYLRGRFPAPSEVEKCQFTLLSSLLSSLERVPPVVAVAGLEAVGVIVALLGPALPPSDAEYVFQQLRQQATRSRVPGARTAATFAAGVLAAFAAEPELAEGVLAFLFELADAATFAGDAAGDGLAEPEAGPFNGAVASSEVSRSGAVALEHAQALGVLRALNLLATDFDDTDLGAWDELPARLMLDFAARCLRRRRLPELSLHAAQALGRLCTARHQSGQWQPDDVLRPPVRRSAEFLRAACGSTAEKTAGDVAVARDERRARRAVFRVALAAVEGEEDSEPRETLGLRAGAVTVAIAGWGPVVACRLLADLLGGSFLQALENCPWLQDALGVDEYLTPRPPAVLHRQAVKKAKKMRGAVTKVKDLDRAKERSEKRAREAIHDGSD